MNPPATVCPGQSRSQGFTLIEMMAVVAILGIMLMMAVTSVDWLLPDTRLASSARELASFIEDARDVAIMEGRPVLVEYNLGDDEGSRQYFRSIRTPNPGEEQDFEDLEGGLTLVDWRECSRGIRIAALLVDVFEPVEKGYYSVQANPDGTITPHVIHLYCEEIDQWYSVLVQSLLGEADARAGQVAVQFLTEEAF